MESKLYFWKESLLASKRNMSILLAVVAVLIISGCAAGYYYMAYKPAEEARKQVEQARKKTQADISRVDKFYEMGLKGGSTSNLEALAKEIYQSDLGLQLSGFTPKKMSCNPQGCTFSYQLTPGRIFNTQKKRFWKEEFDAKFSEESLDYSGIPSGLTSNPLLESYKRKQDLPLESCTNILNYIQSYNSYYAATQPQWKIKLKGYPASSVAELESQLAVSIKYHGALFSEWEVALPKSSTLLEAVMLLNKQPYTHAFIIKTLMQDDKGIHITGGIACKKGS